MRITEESVNRCKEIREAAIQSNTNPEVAIVEHIAQECGPQLACKYAELAGSYPPAFIKKFSDQHETSKRDVNRPRGSSHSRNSAKHRMRSALFVLCAIVLLSLLVLCVEANIIPFQILINCFGLGSLAAISLNGVHLFATDLDTSKEAVKNRAAQGAALFIIAYATVIAMGCVCIGLDIHQLSDIDKIGIGVWLLLVTYAISILIWASRKMFKEAKIIEAEPACDNKKEDE